MWRSKLLSIVIALTTCTAASFAQSPPKSTLDVVKERGTLIAGVRNSIPLFGFTDERGNIVGFDIDLVGEVAKSLGVKLELVAVSGSTRIPMLQQGRVDLVAAALGHYRSRDAVVDFTIPYLRTPNTMLVRKGGPIRSLADMADRRLGTDIGSGTVREFPKFQPKAKVQTFESWPDAFLAFQQGLVDAVATDIVILASLRANAPQPEEFEILGPSGQFGSIDWGIGVRENDSKWRDAINYALQDIYKDGRWLKIFEKWLGKESKLKLTTDMVQFDMPMWP